jgi:cell wall-associated NlpC family hydrolase
MTGKPQNNSLKSYSLPTLHDPLNELATNDALMASSTIAAACIVPRTPIKTAPDHTAHTASDLIYGEPIDIIGEKADWLNIISLTDGYKGWVINNAIKHAPPQPTHKIRTCLTHIYRAPDLKSEPLMMLPMGAYVCASADGVGSQKFLALSTGGFIYKTHVTPIGTFEEDPLTVAENFIAAPYLWGGRTCMGIDCSGLVQVSLANCGHRVLRDSTGQHRNLGRALTPSETPQRGDLAFLNGHVGWMMDGIHLLHANATHMAVTVNPAEDVLRWLEKEFGAKAFLEYRRLSQ